MGVIKNGLNIPVSIHNALNRLEDLHEHLTILEQHEAYPNYKALLHLADEAHEELSSYCRCNCKDERYEDTTTI